MDMMVGANREVATDVFNCLQGNRITEMDTVSRNWCGETNLDSRACFRVCFERTV